MQPKSFHTFNEVSQGDWVRCTDGYARGVEGIVLDMDWDWFGEVDVQIKTDSGVVYSVSDMHVEIATMPSKRP